MTAQELCVQVLGPVRARCGDQHLGLGAARERAVFAVLALQAGHVIGRDDLVSAIWGESPPVSSAGLVHTYVCGLRRVLEPDRSPRAPSEVLASAGDGYSLRVAPDQVDAHHCATLRARSDVALGRGDLAGALAACGSALALWRGDPLSGLRGPFAERHRARLTDLRLALREQHADLLSKSGRHTEAVAGLTELVAAHPFREHPRGLLMLALYRAGRQAEALEVYRHTRRLLVEQLGVEPGVALRETHTRVLAGDVLPI